MNIITICFVASIFFCGLIGLIVTMSKMNGIEDN